MNILKNIRYLSLSIAMGVVTLFLIGFAMKKRSDRRVKDVVVNIKDNQAVPFVEVTEVTEILNETFGDFLIHQEIKEINYRELENRLEEHAFIKKADVFSDISGALVVNIFQHIPIARIYSSKTKDYYISTEGVLLPMNARTTARVPIITFQKTPSWKKSLTENEYGQKLIELFSFIHTEEFWKFQIAQINVLSNGEIEMIPQISKQKILFGQPDHIESKFSKLEIAFLEILPNKGWNTYETINVKFKNQIVCQ